MYGKSAQLYDLTVDAAGKDYTSEAREVDRIVQQRKPGARTLLDVACGTGRHLAALGQRYEVVGTDVEPSMLSEAARNVPGVELLEADMRTLALGRRFDAVTCLSSSIGYMGSAAELDVAVAAMAAHLQPRGVLIVDGWIRPDRWRDGRVHMLTLGRRDVKFARVSRSQRRGSQSQIEMHYLLGTSDRIEHVVDWDRLTLFTPDQYESAFLRAELSVEVMPSPTPDRDRYVGVTRGS